MGTMRFSIGKKLMVSGIFVFVLVLLITATSLLVIRLFKETSNKLVIEYIELDAILEFKLSLSQLQHPISRYAVYGDDNIEAIFDALVLQAQNDLSSCQNLVTSKHDHELLRDYIKEIHQIDSIAKLMFALNPIHQKDQSLYYMEMIIGQINKGVGKIDILLRETKLEIDAYSKKNKTMIRHSTLTVFSLGLAVMFIVIIGGLWFIRSLTKPIHNLVSATENISRGGKLQKVSFNSGDELGQLAESFNTMVETLQKTTVSRNYLNSIMESMQDPLIVTDTKGLISLVNYACCNLLKYSEFELLGKDIDILFCRQHAQIESPKFNLLELLVEDKLDNTEKCMFTKSGNKIPVLLSGAVLKDEAGKTDQTILVAHDLTTRNAIAQNLEKERKKRLIAINEAQEEERFRVAIDLHDGLGQTLTAISYTLQEKALSKNDQNTTLVNKIQALLDTAIKETKTLAHNLVPIVLKDFGLIVAITKLIEQANQLQETDFKFNAYDFDERIDPKIEKALYRICQESVNNIIKHANAKTAHFQLFRHDASLVLVIDDDGVGFDHRNLEMGKDKSGIGLVSMRERVLSFDGEFSIDSELNNGTEIVIEIPCKNTAT